MCSTPNAGNKNITNLVAQWMRPEILALDPYHVPDSADFLKLDAMENPYDWPEPLVSEWLGRLKNVKVNRYPDSTSSVLQQRLREVMDIPQELEIILGNGSDELIQMINMAVAERGRTVLALEPSFSMYKLISACVGLDYQGVSLNSSDFSIDAPAMKKAIGACQPAIVFLASPNNPTGNLMDERQLCEIIEMSPGLVVIDEAYYAYANYTMMGHMSRYKNLLILRTLSKIGLAGLRLGVLIGAKPWLLEVNKIRLPYNINALTQASALFALDHRDVFQEQVEKICVARDQLIEKLNALDGVMAYQSSANFILFRVPSGKALSVFQALKERGVLVKNVEAASPLLRDCLRVTVGTAEENKEFVTALTAIL